MWYTHGRHAPSFSLHVLTSLLIASFTKDCLFSTPTYSIPDFECPRVQQELETKYMVVNSHFHFTYARDFQQLPSTTKIQQERNNYTSSHVNKQTVIQNLPFATRNSSSSTPGGWGTHSPEGRYLVELWKLQICPDLAPLHLHEDPITQPKWKSMNTALKSIFKGRRRRKTTITQKDDFYN